MTTISNLDKFNTLLLIIYSSGVRLSSFINSVFVTLWIGEYLEINELPNFLDEKNYSGFLQGKCKPTSKYKIILNQIKKYN